MTNKLKITILREKATSNQQGIDCQKIDENNIITVTCFNNATEMEVLESVMWWFDGTQLMEEIIQQGYKDIIVNEKLTWSISFCELK